MRKITKTIASVAVSVMVAVSMTPALPAMVTYAAETGETTEKTSPIAQDIFDKLVAEGSTYSEGNKDLAKYGKFHFKAVLNGNRITVSFVPDSEDYNKYKQDCFYDYDEESGCIVCNATEDDTNTLWIFSYYIVDAVADHLGMDSEVLRAYLTAVEATQEKDDVLTSEYYNYSAPDEHGIRTISLYAKSEYDKNIVSKVIEEAYFTPETLETLEVSALTSENTSQYCNLGKYHLYVDGNKNDVTITLSEYNGISEQGIESLKNIINAFQPEGYEDFIANYKGTPSELADSSEAWKVVVPDADLIPEAFKQLNEGTNFVQVTFATPYFWDGEEVSLKAGETQYLFLNNGQVSKWESSNKKVATISDNGTVTGLKKGTATITATLDNGEKLSIKVNVTTNPTIKVNGKKFSKTKTYTVKKGKSLTVKINGKAADVKNAYSSSNKKVAKVTSKKTATTVKIKGVKKGKATVTVKVNGVSFKIKVKVK